MLKNGRDKERGGIRVCIFSYVVHELNHDECTYRMNYIPTK